MLTTVVMATASENVALWSPIPASIVKVILRGVHPDFGDLSQKNKLVACFLIVCQTWTSQVITKPYSN